jgi:hypothetical protein
MINNNLKDLFLSQSPRDLNGCWAKICIDCLGSYEFKDAQYIKISWQKNCKKFKDLVNEKLKLIENYNENHMDCSEISNNINVNRIELPMEIVFELKKNILFKPRKYIRKSVISKIINEKLLEYDVKCLLKCKFNWFLSSKTSPFRCWKGSFICLSGLCALYASFEQDGFFNREIIIKLNWIKSESHKE